jgi:hypothetical protein
MIPSGRSRLLIPEQASGTGGGYRLAGKQSRRFGQGRMFSSY